MHSPDLDDFAADLRWLFTGNTQYEAVAVHAPGNTPLHLTAQFIDTFPILADLLAQARVTEIRIGEQASYLLGWTDVQGRSLGWQSPLLEPEHEHSQQLHPDHRLLLTCFGGIEERWHEPGT